MIKPTPGFVFVKEEKTEGQTASGIITKEEGKKTIGTVYSVTNDKGGFFYDLLLRHFSKDRPIRLSVGDRVMFSKYVCEDVYMEDEEGKQVKDIHMLPISMISATIHD